MQPVGQLDALRVLDIHTVATKFSLGSHASQEALLVDHPPRVVVGNLTGECLKYLTGTANLRAIYFSFAVDDEGLAQLAALRNLQIRTLVLRDVTAAGMSRLPYLRRLETLVIEGASVGSHGLQYLAYLPNLRWLQLRDVQAAEGGWQALGELPQLQKLSLAGSPIDDAGLKNLAGLKRLEKLSLRSGSVNDQNVVHLAGLTTLRELDLRDTLVTADALDKLKNLVHLEQLGFQSPLDDDAVRCLKDLPRLRQLLGPNNGFSEFYLTDAGVAEFAKLRVLRGMTVHDAIVGAELKGVDVRPGDGTITNVGLACLWDAPAIGSVTVSGREITDAGLRWGPQMSGWSSIRLISPRPLSEVITRTLDVGAGSATFGDRSLSLRAYGGIGPRSFTLSHSGLECQLEVLRHLPKIERLKLTEHLHQESTACDWDHLRFVPALQDFEMSTGLYIDAIGLSRLGEMENLRRLICNLSDNVTAEDFAPLGGLKNLGYLELHSVGLNADYMRVLGQLTNLQELRVFETAANVSEALGVEHLTELGRLKTLQLHRVTDEDMPSLGKIEGLTWISLKNHKISDEGFEHLKNLPALKYLAVDVGMTTERLEGLAARFPGVRVRTN
jgi:Leucine-rich repeat (LRR) protein